MKQVRSGQSFLYRNAGYDSTVIEVKMKDRVTGSYLQVALTDTVKRFPYMTDKLVEKNGKYYTHPDLNSMTVNKTKKFRPLLPIPEILIYRTVRQRGFLCLTLFIRIIHCTIFNFYPKVMTC